jgi:hypothetical protein
MDANGFWELIEKSRQGVDGCEEQAERLLGLLRGLPADKIVEFKEHFHDCLDRSYRWDLWAVAYIVRGGCSDDSFEYFRCWLIGQGRAYFEAALASPRRAADGIKPGDDAECEDLLYVAGDAYEEATGEEGMPRSTRKRPAEPAGEEWDEDKVDQLYPDLAERFN